MTHDRILIVDDNPMNLKLARILLAGEGFDVRTATESGEALEVLKTFHPRLILMDIQLPGMDGLTLTRRLKAEPATRDIIILALTAYAMKGDDDRARDAGCDGYITKPIDTRLLPRVIREHLQGRAHPELVEDSGGKYQDVLAEARNNLLAEGIELVTQFLLSAGAGTPDLSRIQSVCHTWVGTAGSLGLTDIAKTARQIEQNLRSADEPRTLGAEGDFGDHQTALQLDLSRLLALFKDGLKGARKREPLPKAITSVIAGKLFGVIGFEPPEVRRITQTLHDAGALTGCCRDLPSAADLRFIDVAIVDANQPPSGIAGKSGSAFRKPLLMIGPAEALLQFQSQSEAEHIDFLPSPWDPDELVLRTYRMLVAREHHIPRDSGASRPRVLIVDDDPQILKIVRSALEIFDVQCDVALDGESAMVQARTLRPDIMILDVNLPDIDGFGVLMALKRNERTTNIRVVLLTAVADNDAVVRGFGLGADDYVRKPFSPMELAARVIRLTPPRGVGSQEQQTESELPTLLIQ